MLNDCLLSSYLTTIRQNPSALRPYYDAEAYLRDNEILDVAQHLIEGLETIKTFMLPCNSSLLNSWSMPSLVLAGVWSPTLRSCPVSSGVDVAESLQATSSFNSETSSLASESMNSFSSGIAQILPVNEEEALRIILAKHSSDSPTPPPTTTTTATTLTSTTHDDYEKFTSEVSVCKSNIDSDDQSMLGNSLNRKSCWSFDQNQAINSSSNDSCESPKAETEVRSMEASFNALIESYNMCGGNVKKTPDVKDVLQTNCCDKIAEHSKLETGNEFLPLLASHIGKLPREKGLDFQNFECAACKHPLGLSHKPK